jgi:UDP-N-acetylmuramate dehydrogenase
MRVERFDVGEHGFSYRRSRYASSKNLTVLAAELTLFPREQGEIDSLMEDYRRRRRQSQPLEYPNAGSVFKNPEGDAAGRLIESCGLKGLRVGGACVSDKHANFIINTGGASRRDVLELIDLIRTQVLRQTGVELVCELQDLEGIARMR